MVCINFKLGLINHVMYWFVLDQNDNFTAQFEYCINDYARSLLDRRECDVVQLCIYTVEFGTFKVHTITPFKDVEPDTYTITKLIKSFDNNVKTILMVTPPIGYVLTQFRVTEAMNFIPNIVIPEEFEVIYIRLNVGFRH